MIRVLLSLRNVSLSFPRGRRHVLPVLSNVSLDVDTGELVAVLAQRAQGKTTMLRVAAGMDRPSRGEVLFKGQDLHRLSDRRRSALLRQKIGFAEPIGPDIDLPVLARVAVPLLATCSKRDAYERALSVLTRLGVEECANQPWASLADSERALAALAQAIVREPELLLVDDLTTTLGIDATERIGRLLRSIALEDGLAVLMSVSDADATTWFDRVASLSGGELVQHTQVGPGPENVIDFPSDPARRASS
ncbi:MAG TPA: ATP-binding cassette domain-containing protein [Solirubrobacteraceae bacterium]